MVAKNCFIVVSVQILEQIQHFVHFAVEFISTFMSTKRIQEYIEVSLHVVTCYCTIVITLFQQLLLHFA